MPTSSQKPDTSAEAELDALVAQAIGGLNLNGKADDIRQWAATELVRRRAEPLITALADSGADLPDLAAHSHPFDPDAAAQPADWLVGRLTVRGSNTLVVAPTQSGGSSLLIHLAASILKGEPVLGLLPVTRTGSPRVLWVNPEEDDTLPNARLADHGVTVEDTEPGRWLQVHSRDSRLYLNRPRHVTHLIRHLDGLGWSAEDGRPVVVIVDGLQPTLAGDLWGGDLEAWKEGVGRLRDHLHPEALFVRAQTLSSSARHSSRRGTVKGEDVAGGQVFQWPDHRLTLNRDGDLRVLNIRGRYTGQDGDGFDLTYSRDDTGRLWVVEAEARLWAVVRVTTYLSGSEWRANGHRSGRSVAEHLHALDLERKATTDAYTVVSDSTYRRAMEEWTFDKDSDTWRPTPIKAAKATKGGSK
jgi:hypothetical protein